MGDAEMKAVVVEHFGGPEVLQTRSVPMPVPGAGEVRVRLMATGVNPVETYIRAGAYGAVPSLPYVPGNDGAGIVDAVGAGVENVQVGERVFVAATGAKHNTGTYATFVVCDASAVGRLPHDVSFEQGAGIGTPGLAAGDALFVRARVQPGETVLVHERRCGNACCAACAPHRMRRVRYCR